MNITIVINDISIDELLAKLVSIRQCFSMETIMSALTDLQTRVEQNNTVIGSAVVLLQGLKAKLDEAIASNDPAQLKALSDALGQSDQSLAEAITTNTPAE